MSMTVRTATSSDVEIIVGFNDGLARETENKVLDLDVVRAGVERFLSEPSRGQYFLAETDGEVLGQIMITYEWSDWRNGNFWWLQSVYVAHSARGKGAFSTILGHIRSLAEADPFVCGIRLYVDKDNCAAQKSYGARGFAFSNYEVMALEFSNTE